MNENPKRNLSSTTARIGNTNLIKLQNIPTSENIKTEVYVKTENENPSGNITDRVVKQILDQLVLKYTSSSNTRLVSVFNNLSLSLVLLCKSYNFTCSIICKDNLEKNVLDMLRLLGADLVFENQNGFLEKYCEENKFVNFDQFLSENQSQLKLNLFSELEDQIDNFDYVFMSEKTAEYFGENPKLVRVGLNGKSNLQETVQVERKNAVLQSRNLINQEGLLVGEKSGLILSGALNYLKTKELDQKENTRIIIILEDSLNLQNPSIVNENNLISQNIICGKTERKEKSYCGKNSISDFSNLKPIAYYDSRLTIGDCYDLLKTRLSFIPIRKQGKIVGVVDKKSLLKNVIVKNLDKNNSCIECIRKDFYLVDYEVPFFIVEKMLEEREYVVIVKRKEDGGIRCVYGFNIDDLVSMIDSDMNELV